MVLALLDGPKTTSLQHNSTKCKMQLQEIIIIAINRIVKLNTLTLISLGFLYMFRFGGRDVDHLPPPLIIIVVCGPIATKFCTGINNQSISSNMENLHKINDIIILRNLSKKTIKRVYFKIAAVSSSFIQSY